MQNPQNTEGVLSQFEITKGIYTSGMLKTLKISPCSKLVLIAISQHYPNIFPSKRFLAENLGISERSVDNAINELRTAGLIIYETKRVNNYKFTQKFFELINFADNDRKKCVLNTADFAHSINLPSGAFSSMLSGEAPFPDDKVQKMAAVMKVSIDEIKGWILADKYPENVLKRALEVKQDVKPDAGILILTAKIDEILKEKGLSRTRLSNIIGYSQGKLNEMIKGVEPMSPLVISKIAPVLEVSEDEITSWIVTDKYSANALRVAVEG